MSKSRPKYRLRPRLVNLAGIDFDLSVPQDLAFARMFMDLAKGELKRRRDRDYDKALSQRNAQRDKEHA
jgi:hypothetical protein